MILFSEYVVQVYFGMMVSGFIYLVLLLFYNCTRRLIVMNIKEFVASMEFPGTLQLNGFPRDLWNPKSEYMN